MKDRCKKENLPDRAVTISPREWYKEELKDMIFEGVAYTIGR